MDNGGENYPLMISLQIGGAIVFAIFAGGFIRQQLRQLINSSQLIKQEAKQRYLQKEAWSYSIALVPIIGSIGIDVTVSWYFMLFILFVIWQFL